MPISFFWAGCVIFTGLSAEYLAAQTGILFAGVLLSAFYLSISYNVRTGTIWGILSCLALEIILGRTITALPLFLPLYLSARYWQRYGDRGSASVQMIPAAIIGGIYASWCLLPEVPSAVKTTHARAWLHLFELLGGGFVTTALGGPLLFLLWDKLARAAQIPQFFRRKPSGAGP